VHFIIVFVIGVRSDKYHSLEFRQLSVEMFIINLYFVAWEVLKHT